MRHEFQLGFEKFLYRLFTIGELAAQLSNVYHRRDLEPKNVRYDYWEKLVDALGEDDFSRAVMAFRKAPLVASLYDLRNGSTHRFAVDLVGIGWPAVTPILDEHGEVSGFGMGSDYVGRVDFDQALVDMKGAFEEVAILLRKLEGIVRAESPALTSS